MQQTKDERIEFLEKELDRALSNLSRMARESHSFKTAYDKTYTKLRSLENAVRVAVDPASGVSLLDSLLKLSRMIPRQPRPTLTQVRRKMYERSSRS
jgi:hypothetical protein